MSMIGYTLICRSIAFLSEICKKEGCGAPFKNDFRGRIATFGPKTRETSTIQEQYPGILMKAKKGIKI